jgi:YbbR domain-containing protein
MIKRLLVNNFVIKIVAFFLALILWMYVSSNNLPNFQDLTTTFSDVPLAYRNLDESLTIIRIPVEVDVLLSGSADAINAVRPQELEVYVDLRGLGEGTHRITPNALIPRGVRVENFRPSQVTVEIEEIINQQKPVVIQLLGEQAAGFNLGEPRIEPDQVFVRGPRSALPEVLQIRAVVDISGLDNDVNETVTLVAKDQFGRPVEGIIINPSEVNVRISIKEPQKEIPVKLKLTGEVATGYQIVQVTVTPATVLATAAQGILDTLESITAPEFDVSGASATINTELILPVPDGVKLSQTIVAVEIEIEPL